MDKRMMLATGTHPETYTVDLYDWRSGWRMKGVPVLTGPATGRTGAADLPVFTEDAPGMAVVDFIDGSPVVMGFLHNRLSALRFADGRMVWRHDSDAYITLDRDANLEYRHPSGAYFAISESGQATDLAGQDRDGQWAIDRNTGRAVTLRAAVRSGGEEMASATLKPSGEIDLVTGTASLTMLGSGSIVLAVGGTSITLTADGIVFNTPQLDINET